MQRCDFLVIGGGVVGLTTAMALRRKFPDQTVTVIDKDHCGAHASGRNSGVLHAGFYYGEDSLKARFSVEGCARMAQWCDERGLPVRRCGKLVVARTLAQHVGLDTLVSRAAARRSGGMRRGSGRTPSKRSVSSSRARSPCCRTWLRISSTRAVSSPIWPLLVRPAMATSRSAAWLFPSALESRRMAIERAADEATTGRSTCGGFSG